MLESYLVEFCARRSPHSRFLASFDANASLLFLSPLAYFENPALRAVIDFNHKSLIIQTDLLQASQPRNPLVPFRSLPAAVIRPRPRPRLMPLPTPKEPIRLLPLSTPEDPTHLLPEGAIRLLSTPEVPTHLLPNVSTPPGLPPASKDPLEIPSADEIFNNLAPKKSAHEYEAAWSDFLSFLNSAHYASSVNKCQPGKA